MRISNKRGWIVALVVVLDQIINMKVGSLPLGKVFYEIPGLVSFEHCVNTGAAFSMFSEQTWLLAVASVVLIAVMLFYVHRYLHLTPLPWAVMECLVGGGMGNLLDRLLFSGVTDYIRLKLIDFPVFNLADVAITASIVVILVLLFTDTLEERVEEKHGSDG